jgi:hypothetical protein
MMQIDSYLYIYFLKFYNSLNSLESNIYKEKKIKITNRKHNIKSKNKKNI